MLMAPCAKIPMLSKKSPRVSKVKSLCTREFVVYLGLNWLKIRALVALFTFELGPPHNGGWALGGFSEEMSPKTCTSIEREVI